MMKILLHEVFHRPENAHQATVLDAYNANVLYQSGVYPRESYALYDAELWINSQHRKEKEVHNGEGQDRTDANVAGNSSAGN